MAERSSSSPRVANRGYCARHRTTGGDMKRMLLTGLLALWTGLAAATPLPEWVNSVPPAQMHLGQALDTRSGEWLEPDELVERIRNADRVLLGEQHDNDDHHR